MYLALTSIRRLYASKLYITIITYIYRYTVVLK